MDKISFMLEYLLVTGYVNCASGKNHEPRLAMYSELDKIPAKGMNSEYKLDNGWIVERNGNSGPVLHVTPIPNALFKKHQEVKIPEEIFEDIAQGERDVKNLFKKHKLHKIIIDEAAVEVRSSITLTNTQTKFYGRGFIATQERDQYFLEYQLARQGGGSRKFEITSGIYEDARTGKYSTSDLFKKYNLYHLDGPENDVR